MVRKCTKNDDAKNKKFRVGSGVLVKNKINLFRLGGVLRRPCSLATLTACLTHNQRTHYAIPTHLQGSCCSVSSTPTSLTERSSGVRAIPLLIDCSRRRTKEKKCCRRGGMVRQARGAKANNKPQQQKEGESYCGTLYAELLRYPLRAANREPPASPVVLFYAGWESYVARHAPVLSSEKLVCFDIWIYL